MSDLLAGAAWRCAPARPGAGNPFPTGAGIPAAVPGTVAGALRAAAGQAGESDYAGPDVDTQDWWYTCEFAGPEDHQPFSLGLTGLATLAEIWFNGSLVGTSHNAFLPLSIPVTTAADNELTLRFAALEPQLATPRRPRPRWKVARLSAQNLRWHRTPLWGRLVGGPKVPAVVGPWRPITLTRTAALRVTMLRAEVVAGVPVLEVEVRDSAVGPVTVEVGGTSAVLDTRRSSGRSVRLEVPDAELWWPHTHGEQPLYPVTVRTENESITVGPVGFRTVEVDRSAGAFDVSVNGVAVFCRGAVWSPLDPVDQQDEPAALRAALGRLRTGSMNMVRIPGDTVWPGPEFLRLCDELGILLWQDCMFAFADVPAAPAFVDDVRAEVTAQFTALAGHPCVSVISGGSEIEQQAAFFGVGQGVSLGRLHDEVLPRLAADLLPGVPFVRSSPTGGVWPTDPRSGVSHYFGVGAYRGDSDDARRSGVRFAAECLAFSIPPEPSFVDHHFGGAAAAGHTPAWKAGVYRDADAVWDFEDIREHYAAQLFGDDYVGLRFVDPDRALDLGRATVAELFTRTLSEWRRPRSSCRGALVLNHHDAVPGAGLGLVDSSGRPKAPWFALRRLMAPVAVSVTDEGLNGLDAHLNNDREAEFPGQLRVDLFANGETLVESVARDVVIPARGGLTVALTGLFPGFRDLSYAYRFGPAVVDVVAVTLSRAAPAAATDADVVIGQAVHLPTGPRRPVEFDLGLTATLAHVGDGWQLDVGTRRFAQWVAIDGVDLRPADSWFHLPPGAHRSVKVQRSDGSRPAGQVRALNALHPVRF